MRSTLRAALTLITAALFVTACSAPTAADKPATVGAEHAEHAVQADAPEVRASPPSPVYTDTGFVPCAGKDGFLWAWAWAGANAEHVTTVDHHRDPQKKRWSLLRDVSGNGRDFYNNDGNGPGFQRGYEWYCDDCPDCSDPPDGRSICETAHVASYETQLPVIGVHLYRPMLQRFAHLRNYRQKSYNFFKNVAYQNASMNADGGFYLAFAGLHGRGKGYREMFGSDRQNNTAIQQSTAEVFITIAGEKYRLTEEDAFPRGPMIMETLRDEQGQLRVWVNGKDVTRSDKPIVNTSVFDVSGLAFKGGGGHSYWDDGAFEYILCKGTPPQALRAQTLDYLNEKWRIF